MSATAVAPLRLVVPVLCPVCKQAEAFFQVGPDETACVRCVGVVLRALYAAEPRPFQPYLPTPLKRGKW